VIFVTVGSQLPFDRMTSAVVAWARAHGRSDVFLQTGDSAVDVTGFESVRMLDSAGIQRQFDRASVVVAHAGTGTMIECMLRGTPVIVMPRSAALHETRNDHQFATARKFASRAGIFVAWDEKELPALLDRAATLARGCGIKPHAEESLLSALRAFAAE
jgi:UDP-N-acetylglucosamine transferase subunit ALG13